MVEPLLEFDQTKNPADDIAALLVIMEWGDKNLQSVYHKLSDIGISQDGADLITSCLFPRPEERPRSMDEILSSPFWKEFRRQKDRNRSKHHEESVGSISEV